MNRTESDVKRACVIGAGSAGLCAIRHLIAKGFAVICYEQAKELGGTWIYSENVQDIAHEDEVQSSMYEGLRTNLPKEVMGYPDFLYPNDSEVSFITSDKVLNFLKLYADHFHLNEHIKYRHEVIRVRPRSYTKNAGTFWEVFVKDHQAEEYETEFFDYIFICNGHYTTPEYPIIENMHNYKGKQMHSHLYRNAKQFEDETVLVIGGGPSGIDIACQLSRVAKRVFLSHHLEKVPIRLNIIQKPDVERFTENGAIFKDGSVETFSAVIFSTGYKYSFPFLSIDCAIRIEDNSIQPLYNHILNINHPSMAFIGLPYKVCPTQTFDLQVRFALKYYMKEKQLPSQQKMLNDLEDELKERLKSGLPLRRYHEMAQRQFEYYEKLSRVTDIEPIKPVISKIMKACAHRFVYESDTYRDYAFKVLDDSNFETYKIKFS